MPQRSIVLLGQFPFAQYPIIPGREVAGVVEKVGPNVAWPKVGDRVGMTWLFSSRGHCILCAQDNEVLCPEMQVTGVTKDGYQEFMGGARALCCSDSRWPRLRRSQSPDVRWPDRLQRPTPGRFEPGDKVAVIGLGGLAHPGVLYQGDVRQRRCALQHPGQRSRGA